jgi:serine/threonine protein kinase/WD40 repeat protein
MSKSNKHRQDDPYATLSSQEEIDALTAGEFLPTENLAPTADMTLDLPPPSIDTGIRLPSNPTDDTAASKPDSHNADPNITHSEVGEGTADFDLAEAGSGPEEGTVDFDPNKTTDDVGNGTVEYASNMTTDGGSEKTLDLVSNKTTDDNAAATFGYEVNLTARDADSATIDIDSTAKSNSNSRSTPSTSAPVRVSQIWAGMLKSDATPTSGLRSIGQATDSVFDLVATRSVSEEQLDSAVVPDYKLIRKVGEGAMGVVYSARQKAIGRIVALKAIKSSHQANIESRKKFFYEAQITGDLDHPNIVPIHELGASQEGMLFYSMKLIGGTEWKEVIKKNTRDENLEILLKVCDAVAFAHSKSVIHRDLKPENTMLGQYGEVFVTDWGLAVNLDEKREFSLGGTPVYMAPEMAAHDLKKIGLASDIYVLGGILYQIVTGRGPHPGRTVTECLRAAIKNQFNEAPGQDPLLDIALRAMAKEPTDRYASVADFQAAIREYRRNAESISIANRSGDLLTQAESEKDYEKFSRSIFGYSDALELWPANEAAIGGLQKARFAYGKCAFERGDYDLCLATLDQAVPEQAALYAVARQAKLTADSREQRFKALRKVLIGTIAGAVVGLSALTVYAMYSRSQAVTQKTLAEAARNEAVKAKEKEESAKQVAVEAKNKAEEARRLEETARQEAVKQKEAAENAQREELVAKEDALRRKAEAEQARDQEVLARQAEATAKRLAEQRAVEVQLGNYRSTLALAKAQQEQFDTAGSRRNLEAVAGIESPILAEQNRLPKLDSWAWHRIQLLTNSQLPRFQLGSRATAVDFSESAKLAVIGTIDGSLRLFEFSEREPVRKAEHKSDQAIEAVAMSPDGEEVVFSVNADGDGPTVFAWRWRMSVPPVPLDAVRRRSMQGLVSTRNGKHFVAGINSGLWGWNRDEQAWFTRAPDRRLPEIRGRVRSIQAIDGDRLLIVAELNSRFHIHIADLNGSSNILGVSLPDEISSLLRSAAWSFVDQRILLGLADGRLFSGKFDRSEKLSSMSEILPRKHQAAVEAIAVHSDGVAITSGKEPVVHVWRANSAIPSGWSYDTFLAGTIGNVDKSAFAGDSKSVLGIDENGEVLIWNIEEQKRFRTMARSQVDGRSPAYYASPVKVAVPQSKQSVFSVDENGVVDRWNAGDGRSLLHDGSSRWIWYGHLPGAKIVDVAINKDRSRMITSASLRGVSPEYHVELRDADFEFCLWDLEQRKLLRRWWKKIDVDQRLSLLNSDRMFVASSDDTTEIIHVDDGRVVAKYSDFGTYFAVPHPIETSKMMLVKRSGAVRVYDLDAPDTWSAVGYRDFSLASNSDVPAQGAWSVDGRRFYLLFSSGRIAIFDWRQETLRKSLILGAKGETDTRTEALGRALDPGGVRLSNHLDVDFTVSREESRNRIDLVHRLAGRTPTTKRVSFFIDDSGKNVADVQVKESDGIESPVQPALARVAYGLNPIDFAQAGDGSRIAMLYRDGTVRSLQLNGAMPVWSTFAETSAESVDIELSVDGSRLAIRHADGKCRIIDGNSGRNLAELADVTAVKWDSTSPGGFVFVDVGGSITSVELNELYGSTNKLIGKIDIEAGEKIRSISQFSEHWQSDRPPTRYWMILSGTSDDSRLQFVPADPSDNQAMPAREAVRLVRGAVVIGSPTDNLLAIGKNGLVSLWLCLPSLDQPRPLYDLEGHRGASIQTLAFTPDGETLISTDNQMRVLIWPSRRSDASSK